jgi:hypothetical protein
VRIETRWRNNMRRNQQQKVRSYEEKNGEQPLTEATFS